MPLWQRLLVTLAAMFVVSLVAGLMWRWLFDAAMPAYWSGIVGGITAVPVWELLKKIEIKPSPQ